MEARIPTHSSFIWRSIAQAREVIVKGSRWCVGDGAAINIWQDKWIPFHNGHKVISPPNTLQASAKVCELLSPSFSWNTELIEEIFLPFEAESIKQIPLVRVNKPDRLIWAQSPNGCFLVQSAYHMLVEESRKRAQRASSSSAQRWSSFWNKLWSIQVPQKIRLFMWKTCSNILPICIKLFDRKIISNFSCSVYGEEAKTISHMFIDCPIALEVWSKYPLYMTLLQFGMCFVDWVKVILSNLSSLDIEIFFTLAWFIWRHCNEVWLGSHPGGIHQIAFKASKYALEYLEVVSDPPLFQEAYESKWSPPSSPQFFKVNVASVIFKDKREAGISVVVRKSLGEVPAATSKKVKCEGDMLWTLAISMLKTLKLLLFTGFFTVEIECSNSYLVSLLTSGKNFFTETG